MKATLIVSLACLFACSVSQAEVRGVVISITQTKEKMPLVSIWSDEKSERKADVPLEEARRVVQQMKGWGSSVMVSMVADSQASLPAVQDLLKDIATNLWLDLSYLRVGDPKSGETIVSSKDFGQ